MLTCVLGGKPVAAAQDNAYECRWANGPLEIDGRADEAAWQQSQLIDYFYMPWLGAKARPAKAGTRARLLWDNDHLYFFAEMDDDDLFADVQEHDGFTWNNDVFELFFKPTVNKPGYYEFQVNAANTSFDMHIPYPAKNFLNRFKSAHAFHLESAVIHRGTLNVREDRDEGWSVEGRILWTDFLPTGGRPPDGGVWRFALCRYDYSIHAEQPELSTCAALQRLSFHRHQDYAMLKFLGKAN